MNKTIDDTHWEEIIRAMLDRLGAERFAEVIDYVLDERDAKPAEIDEPPITRH